MRAGENALKKPTSKYPWSPSLRNAGLIRQYWKLRLSDVILSTDHTVRISRLESQITQHEPSFVFPFRHEALSEVDTRHHLNQSSKTLSRIQRDSEGHRQHNLYAILAKYEAGGTSLSPSEVQRRSAGIRNTLTNEACRGKYANIRNQTKKEERSGLQHVNAPADSIKQNISAYAFLQSTPTPDVVWEKVIDRVAIERQILRYNRDSFRAAAESPCGHGLIHDELTFTSLSPAATELLAEHIPPSWNVTSPTLQAFLASFAIPP